MSAAPLKCSTSSRVRRLSIHQVLLALGLVCVYALQADGGPPSLSQIEVRFRLAAPAQLPQAWTLIATPEAEQDQARRVTVRGAKPVTLTLPTGSRWQLAAELPGYWVRPLPLVTAAISLRAHVVLDLWPLGVVRGTVTLEEAKSFLPKRLLVTTVSAPKVLGRPPMPAGVLPCPVEQEGESKGRWSCSLPAGKLDLAISAEGFVPLYIWGVDVAPLGEAELPAFELKRGASIAGWVAVEGGKIDPENCVARLTPAADCRSDLGAALKLSATAAEVKIGGDGFLQFTDVAAGDYALIVEQPGYSQARVDLISVRPKQETFLSQPLVLHTPLSLSLQMDPPLDPHQQPWRVSLYTSASKAANGGRMGIAHEGPADRQGRLLVANLNPGQISVTVEDGAGNRVFTNLLSPWTLDASMSRRIEITQVQIEGSLFFRDEPLAATLWFGGRSGATRVRLVSDEEGRFMGTLPREGYWRVLVQADAAKLETLLATQIERPSDGATRVDLVLPDTRLFGRMIDTEGNPAGRASVTVLGRSHSMSQQTTTDSAGRFEFRGLAEGKTGLVGESSSGCQTSMVFAALAVGEEVGPVVLRCREQRTIEGTVTGARGPVGGARIQLIGQGAQRGVGEARTDSEGRFSVQLPADILSAIVHVAAPGYGYRPRRVTLGEDPLRLRVEEGAGTVEIARRGDEDSLLSRELRIVLLQDGLEVFTNSIEFTVSPADGDHPGWYRYSGLAPGEITACLIYPPSTPGMAPTTSEGPSCDTGLLTTGGILTLTPRPPS